VVQTADLKVNQPFRPDPALFTRNLRSERWAVVVRPFSAIAVIPPFRLSVGGPNDYADFAFLAATHGKGVTAGPLVRVPGDLEEATQKLVREALSGPRDAETLYVFGAATFAERYEPELKPGLRCAEIDAYVACHTDRAPDGDRQR